MDGDIPTAVEGYDPDMTVEEALRKGIIAMIDTGTISSGRYDPCAAYPPRSELDPGMRCTRAHGHAGSHAYVLRWQETFVEIEVREAMVKTRQMEQQRDRAIEQRKQNELAQMAKSVEKMTQELVEPMKEMGKAIKNTRKIEARVESRVYGGLEGKKRDKFRDHNVGKIRGR